jgi:hypothetical protein
MKLTVTLKLNVEGISKRLALDECHDQIVEDISSGIGEDFVWQDMSGKEHEVSIELDDVEIK